jgi:hypothetical protein
VRGDGNDAVAIFACAFEDCGDCVLWGDHVGS